MQTPVYGRMTRTLHWVSALLLLGMAASGAVMTRLSEGVVQSGLYRLHVGLGLLVLLLTIVRLAWRFRDPWPAAPPGLSAGRERVFKWNHILLYAFVIVSLASGAGTLLLSGLSLSPAGVSPDLIQEVLPKKAHVVASRIFVVLFLMHLVGVVQYQMKTGDTLSRMGVNWPRRGKRNDA